MDAEVPAASLMSAVFVGLLSALQADPDQSEVFVFEASSLLTLPTHQLWVQRLCVSNKKVGLSQLSLHVINIHQRLPHLTLHSLQHLCSFSDVTAFILLSLCVWDFGLLLSECQAV